jgi:hypothetical protein
MIDGNNVRIYPRLGSIGFSGSPRVREANLGSARVRLVSLAVIAVVALVAIAIWQSTRPREPASWAAGPVVRWTTPATAAQPQLHGVSDGEISVAVTVNCAAHASASQVLSAHFHAFRELEDAELHTRLIAMPARLKERAVFRRHAPVEIATDTGPAVEVDLLLDPTGSRVALTLVREGDALRIAQFDPAYTQLDYFLAKGVKLLARRTFAVRLPVGASAAIARLETESLLRFQEACR